MVVIGGLHDHLRLEPSLETLEVNVLDRPLALACIHLWIILSFMVDVTDLAEDVRLFLGDWLHCFDLRELSSFFVIGLEHLTFGSILFDSKLHPTKF